jgi:myotubularin-related protein 6/7/8
VENVRLVDRHQNKTATSGTLYVTATHLIFVDPAGKRETWVSITEGNAMLHAKKC